MYKPRPGPLLKLKVATPLVDQGCRLLGLRNFSVTQSVRAKPAPKRSPRVAAQAQSRPDTIRVKQVYDSEESLPPMALLNSARKSGALAIEPMKARDFLLQYQERVGNPNSGWEQKLCSGQWRS